MSNEKTISILPPNKSVVFVSPIEGNDVLVRTGTISEGSCFYHCVLHATSNDYTTLEIPQRIELVKKLRKSISHKIDKKKWEEFSNGLIAKIPYQENINLLFNDFYRYIKKNKKPSKKISQKLIKYVIENTNDKEVYSIIIELLPLEELEKKILPKIYEKTENRSLSSCHKLIVKVLGKKLMRDLRNLGETDEKRIRYCFDKLNFLLKNITELAEYFSFNSYLQSIENNNEDVDTYTLQLLSKKFNRDIYFIDGKNRIPYRMGGDDFIEKRKSIIILWVGGIHYEIIGRLLPENRIQREFDFNDPLIERIYTFLFKPKDVSLKYPNLIPYLPKEIQEDVGFNSSNSESGSRSEESERSESEESNSRSEESEVSESEESDSRSDRSEASESEESDSRSEESEASESEESENKKGRK